MGVLISCFDGCLDKFDKLFLSLSNIFRWNLQLGCQIIVCKYIIQLTHWLAHAIEIITRSYESFCGLPLTECVLTGCLTRPFTFILAADI